MTIFNDDYIFVPIYQTFEVSNAIYGSNWYEGPVEVKKLIQFVLMRAQKSFVVYSGFYEANLNTFSSVSIHFEIKIMPWLFD